MRSLTEVFERHSACIEGLNWAGKRTLRQIWDECQRADWIVWLVERFGVPLKPDLMMMHFSQLRDVNTAWRACDWLLKCGVTHQEIIDYVKSVVRFQDVEEKINAKLYE